MKIAKKKMDDSYYANLFPVQSDFFIAIFFPKQLTNGHNGKIYHTKIYITTATLFIPLFD